jgi:hypothetical protein
MGNRSRRKPFRLRGALKVLVNRADGTYYAAEHRSKAGDQRLCFCGSGFSCARHNTKGERGAPDAERIRHTKRMPLAIYWLPRTRRFAATKLPVGRAFTMRATMKAVMGIDCAVRNPPRERGQR